MNDLFTIALPIVATALSIISIVFVAIVEGKKQTIGFRGSEESRTRRIRIEKALAEEVDVEMQEFLEKCSSGKHSNKEIKEKMRDIGININISKDIATDILDASTDAMERAIRNLLLGSFLAVVSVFMLIFFDLTNTPILFVFLIYVVMGSVLLRAFYLNVEKNRKLEKELILLDETPTIEYASDLVEDLMERDLI